MQTVKVIEYLSKLVFRADAPDELLPRVLRELVKPSPNHVAIRKTIWEGHMRYQWNGKSENIVFIFQRSGNLKTIIFSTY